MAFEKYFCDLINPINDRMDFPLNSNNTKTTKVIEKLFTTKELAPLAVVNRETETSGIYKNKVSVLLFIFKIFFISTWWCMQYFMLHNSNFNNKELHTLNHTSDQIKIYQTYILYRYCITKNNWKQQQIIYYFPRF